MTLPILIDVVLGSNSKDTSHPKYNVAAADFLTTEPTMQNRNQVMDSTNVCWNNKNEYTF